MGELYNSREVEHATILELRVVRLDVLNVPELREFFALQTEKDRFVHILDLSATEFVDSAVIGYFFKVHKDLQQSDGCLCLCNLQPRVVRVLSVNGADKFLPCFNNVDDALKHVARS